MAAVLLGLLAGLVMAEVLVRVLGIEPVRLMTKVQLFDLTADPPVYYHCYPDNRHGEFRPLPDVTRGSWRLEDYTFERGDLPLSKLADTPWCVEYRHSSKGIRNPEIAPQPKPGVTRIAVVGDSFVFGEGVPEEGTLPRQLGQLWGPGVECINGGQVGANTEQEVPILDRIVTDAECSRAILVFIANDVALTDELARRQQYINDFILIRDRYLNDARSSWSGLRILDLARTPGMLRQVHHDTLQWYRDSYDPGWNAENLNALRAHLKSVADRKDCRTVLVLYPLLEGLDGEYPLAGVHQTVRKMAESVGLPVIDLAPAFQGQSTEALWVHAADHHPNSTANALAAKAIDRELRTRFPDFLPGAPSKETAPRTQFGPIRFRQLSPAESGVDFVYYGNPSPRHHMTEQNGGGVAVFDFDADGCLDLFLTNGSSFEAPAEKAGATHRLYRQVRTFDGPLFEDVSAKSGVNDSGFGMGVAAGDYDNDGFTDLFVCYYGRVQLFRNAGDGTFEDVTATAGIHDTAWSAGAAFADLDDDGDLDLYVTTYVVYAPTDPPCYTQHATPVQISCGPIGRVAQADRLWENRGDGTFRDVSEASGLYTVPHGMGLAVEIVDLNGDDRLDVFVANDTSGNQLFENRGGMKFEEVARLKGVAVGADGTGQASMGIGCADFDANGRFDLFVTTFENATKDYFDNLFDGSFVQRTAAMGLDSATRPMLAFGTVAADFDLDGWPDLLIANGHIWDLTPLGLSHLYEMPPQLFRNQAGRRFHDVSAAAGSYFKSRWLGRAAATGDLDNDGDPDLVVGHELKTVVILENDSPRTARRSGTLRFVGTSSAREPLGVRVTCRAGDEVRHYHLPSGGSFAASSDPRLIVTANADMLDEVRIAWRAGKSQTWHNVPLGTLVTLIEDDQAVQDGR